MEREAAKRYILENARAYLEPDKSGRGFICPICGSGRGSHGTGMTTKDGVHFTCWAHPQEGCPQNADIIDIIGAEYGITDYPEKLSKAAEIFNIELDGGPSGRGSGEPGPQIPPKIHRKEDRPKPAAPAKEPEADYTQFFIQANKDLSLTDYHRGISETTLNRFMVGYVEDWKHPKAPRSSPSPRLIIPTSQGSYIARATEAPAPDQTGRDVAGNIKAKVGRVHLFNIQALEKATSPIFIVEGEIDALSVIDAGGEAMGLGGLNEKKLMEALEDHRPEQPIILALDNDKPGHETQQKISEALKGMKIPFTEANIYGAAKDANEALNANPAAFTQAVEQAKDDCLDKMQREREAQISELQKNSAACQIRGFIDRIKESRTAAFYPTGFSGLDEILDGGLYSGLYFIGAINSLGKTTFALQIADQIASEGKDVLIFSLEVARDELMAKSISRLSLMYDMETNGTTRNAKSTRGILTGSRYSRYSKTERDVIQNAIRAYSEYAKHIYITEGVGNIGVDQIRAQVENHIKVTGEAPVILIDYLQILAPVNDRFTDKQNTDKSVLELKRLSRDYGIPVIGISSFNRDNYTTPVNSASFKESGAIEYSSDVLIGLQYNEMDYIDGEKEKDRDSRIRKLVKQQIANGAAGKAQQIQVKVLKNRNGRKGEAVLDFYPTFNYFLENDDSKDDATEDGESWENSESTY